MFKSEKHVFWEALLVTIVIFAIGVFFGVILENWRVSEINSLAQESEIDLLDVKLQNEIYSTNDFNCEKAIDENIKFADRIYKEAKTLSRYEKATRLTQDILIQHRKYDILRATLLINSMKIREKCGDSYHEIVYFYQYNEPNEDTKAKQNVFSQILKELKEREGEEILLIPMAGDNNVSAINLILDKYQASEKDLPIIIIDNNIKITKIQDIETIEKIIFEGDQNIQEDISKPDIIILN